MLQLAANHLVHAWDLTRASDADEELDPDTVTVIRDWLEAAYREMGAIRPPVQAGAGPQAELLAMFGRCHERVDEDTSPPDGRRAR